MKRKIKVSFAIKSGATYAINSFELEIDFEIDDEGLNKIRKMLYNKHCEKYWKNTPEEKRASIKNFQIMDWFTVKQT